MEKKYSIHVIDDGFVNCHPGYITGNAAWPSVTKDENGILYTVYSGNRLLHVDPFGKVFLRTSRDEGKTWSSPRLVIDTPLDDRDAGILNLGNGHLLVSSFNLAPVKLKWSAEIQAKGSPKYGALMLAYLALVTEEQVDKFHGSLFSESFDGGETWSEPFFSPVTAPHGPTLTKNREILYAGNRHDCLDITEITAKQDSESIFVYKGKSPHELSLFCKVPPSEETKGLLLYEPYIIELPSGRLVLHVRLQGTDDGLSNEEDMIFTIGQSVSDDGGKTWSSLHIITEYGSPPHLMLHSSGALISIFGYRKPLFGVQAIVSNDEGNTWSQPYIIWDKSEMSDMGYPCCVELANGDILCVYYACEKAIGYAIRWIRWGLNEYIEK